MLRRMCGVVGVGLSVCLMPALAAAVEQPLKPEGVGESAFWSGEDITAVLGPTSSEALHQQLAGLARPLQVWFMRHPANHAYPPGVSKYVRNMTWDGYTLLTSLAGDQNTSVENRAILIDMEGRVVQEWPLTGIPVKMMPGGYVLGGQGASGTASKAIVEMDLCGNEVWRYDGETLPDYDPDLGVRWHHDIQREGNPVGYYAGCSASSAPLGGKTLFLANSDPPAEATGHISRFPLTDDSIYIVDWDKTLVFEWHAWEHVDQMGFDAKAREAIYDSCLPGGVPSCRPGAPGRTDWTHMNTVSWLGPNKWFNAGDCRFDPDFVMWDARSMNLSAIVATHDCVCGGCRKGDIVWRIGPDFSFGSPDHELGTIIGQHLVHMIPKGLPGAGNVLIFDNGGFAGFGSLMAGLPGTWPVTFRDTSRVIEVNPITKRIVWQYAVPRNGDKEFFSTLISGAQRLPNGNTLITEGGTGRVFEITKAGQIVWEYVSPFVGNVAGGGGFIGPNGVYRAYRVPHSWLPWQVRTKGVQAVCGRR